MRPRTLLHYGEHVRCSARYRSQVTYRQTSERANCGEPLISTEQSRTIGVLVTVRDSGLGAPEHLERIFEAFYTTKSSGVGMGLSICQSIIDAHGPTMGRSERASRRPISVQLAQRGKGTHGR